MAVCMLGFVSTASAYDGDFEISGHINTGVGFQYRSASPWTALGGAFTEEGMLLQDTTTNGVTGKMPHKTNVLFYVGDVELDIAKTFGENIRLRTDLDFTRNMSYGYMANDGNAWSIQNMIEQAYVTINIPVGYGLEFLVGRFNAPMGFEAVDNNDNDLPFHTPIFNFLRPQNLTGIKFYYPFSDMVDLHFWLANTLTDQTRESGRAAIDYRQIPAFGLRLGFTWGMEGQESTLGISGAASSEAAIPAPTKSKYGSWSSLGDLDFNIWVNDVFAIGGEGIFRRDAATKAVKLAGGKSNYYFGGILNLHYLFSDVWDGTLRYTYANDKNGSVFVGNTGASTLQAAPAATQFHRYFASSAMGGKLQDHQIDLGINYHITDGAKLMAMYRFEYLIPAKSIGGGPTARSYLNGNKTGMVQSVAANFAYEF